MINNAKYYENGISISGISDGTNPLDTDIIELITEQIANIKVYSSNGSIELFNIPVFQQDEDTSNCLSPYVVLP